MLTPGPLISHHPFKYFGHARSYFQIGFRAALSRSPYVSSFIGIMKKSSATRLLVNKSCSACQLPRAVSVSCGMSLGWGAFNGSSYPAMIKMLFFSTLLCFTSLSCFCLAALLGIYNLNVLWFASPASCLTLTVMADFFSKDNHSCLNFSSGILLDFFLHDI